MKYIFLVLLLTGCAVCHPHAAYSVAVDMNKSYGFVHIRGCVNHPGHNPMFIPEEGMTIGDLVLEAGGTTSCAHRLKLSHENTLWIFFPSHVYPIPKIGSPVWDICLRSGDTILIE